VLLLAPDGESHDVLTSACAMREPLFASCFSPGRWWRSSERVDKLRLTWEPLDFLSRRPHEISLERVSVLVRSDVEMRESSVSEQGNPVLWEWCFRGPPGSL
jgi:hypothetical protein